jgi:hypothetical protein
LTGLCSSQGSTRFLQYLGQFKTRFGLSKRFGVKNVDSQITNKINLKTVVGTPYYVAPEVLR